MKKILGILAVVVLCTGWTVWAGKDCGSCDAGAKEKSSCGDKACCKETCEKLMKNPGTFAECCGEFCASHKGKDGKVEMACHLHHKCCAEHYAKTGSKECPTCAKAGHKH